MLFALSRLNRYPDPRSQLQTSEQSSPKADSHVDQARPSEIGKHTCSAQAHTSASSCYLYRTPPAGLPSPEGSNNKQSSRPALDYGFVDRQLHRIGIRTTRCA